MNTIDEMITVIDRHGWAQDKLRTLTGRMCLMGALNRAQTGSAGGVIRLDVLQRLERNQVMRAISYTIAGYSDVDIIGWNDAEGRTKAEVVAMLRKASERYEENYGEKKPKPAPVTTWVYREDRELVSV